MKLVAEPDRNPKREDAFKRNREVSQSSTTAKVFVRRRICDSQNFFSNI